MTTRDMTRAQFNAALERNNFTKPLIFWCQDKENPNHSYSIIYSRAHGIHRRATIAHLIACRAQTEKRNALEAARAEGAKLADNGKLAKAAADSGAFQFGSAKHRMMSALNAGLKDL